MAEHRCRCGAPLNPWEDECRHRRACEARLALAAGVPVDAAAAHAQRRNTSAEAHEIRRVASDAI